MVQVPRHQTPPAPNEDIALIGRTSKSNKFGYPGGGGRTKLLGARAVGLSALTDAARLSGARWTIKQHLREQVTRSTVSARPRPDGKMTRSLHVAVLECDTPIPPVKEKLGGYGDIFEGLLKRGAQAGNSTAEIEVSKWHVVGNPVYPDPNEVDAFLLTGSKHDAFGDDRWILTLTEYVRDVVQSHKKPVVGICFGHQILARALNARVGRGEGWEISSSEISLTDAGKELFNQEKIYLHQMHRDIVHEVPEGCVNLGYSPRCGIQGLYMPGRILSVQAHPEFNQFIMTHLCEARHDQGLFDDELYKDGLARAEKHHDGELLGRRIVKFIEESAL